jgi:hypothetical protein
MKTMVHFQRLEDTELFGGLDAPELLVSSLSQPYTIHFEINSDPQIEYQKLFQDHSVLDGGLRGAPRQSECPS